MKLNKIFFSPTNTTKKILDGITKGMSVTSENEYNLNTNDTSKITINSGLSIIGIPVFNGKLNENAVKQLNRFSVEKQLCVVIITYGNSDYQTLLDELNELVKDCGFIPIASAAFLGKTELTEKNEPIAFDRPDEADLKACFNFGKKIKGKLDYVEKIIDDVISTTKITNQ